MKLDIGCGHRPTGDVNCDLFLGKSPHTKFNIKKTNNFVLCDAHILPFRDDSFKIVYSSHVLEHLPDPIKALKEWKRVTDKWVYVKVPNSFDNKQHEKHLFAWEKTTFKQLLETVFSNVIVYGRMDLMKGRILNRMYWVGRFLTFLFWKLLPSELVGICQK